MDTAEIVDRYYELANAGRWDAWCDLFSVDTTMDEQLAGHVEGRETLRDMMKGFPETYARFSNDPQRVVVAGDHAAVISHISGTTRAGDSIEAQVCNYFEIAGGEIRYFANFHDSVPFAPALAKR